MMRFGESTTGSSSSCSRTSSPGILKSLRKCIGNKIRLFLKNITISCFYIGAAVVGLTCPLLVLALLRFYEIAG